MSPELVFLLEELSAKAMLEGLLPKILPEGVLPRFIVFEGKQPLEGQAPRRIRHYRNPNARFIILRDKDAADCRVLKARLLKLAEASGKQGVLVRIACHELESWYLADLAAVGKGLGLPQKIAALQDTKRYMTPDQIVNPSRELEKIVPSYQKVSGSRMIGPHLDPNNSRSTSFSVFVRAVRKLAGEIARPHLSSGQ